MKLFVESWLFVVIALAGWMNREQQDIIEYLKAENRAVTEQLKARGGRLRFNDRQRRQLAVTAKKLGRKALREIGTIVTPDTLLRWHRQLIARKYDGSGKRGPGRPGIMREISRLIILFASENRTWGYGRIQGALSNVGHVVSRSTIANVLARHGLEPAPERRGKTSWQEFLETHWDVLAATDFFTVEIWSPVGLLRYYVLFVIDLSTRRVHIAGIIYQPYGRWMEQLARNLTDDMDGFLLHNKYLIHDRDPVFTQRFREILESGGVQPVKLPPKTPNLNAYAERFVLSIKSECLNRLILFSEAQLTHVITQYAMHYHRERNHQGLDNPLISGHWSDRDDCWSHEAWRYASVLPPHSSLRSGSRGQFLLPASAAGSTPLRPVSLTEPFHWQDPRSIGRDYAPDFQIGVVIEVADRDVVRIFGPDGQGVSGIIRRETAANR